MSMPTKPIHVGKLELQRLIRTKVVPNNPIVTIGRYAVMQYGSQVAFSDGGGYWMMEKTELKAIAERID